MTQRGWRKLWFGGTNGLAYLICFGVVFVTNVRPAIEAKEYGHAFCYAVFVLIMTQIFGGMKHHPGWNVIPVFLVGMLYFAGNYFNNIGSTAKAQDAINGTATAKIQTIGDWDTQITNLTTEQSKLPTFERTTEAEFNAAKETWGDAKKVRDAECKFMGTICRQKETAAATAETKYKDLATRWGLTQDADRIERSLTEARTRKGSQGAKPRYGDAAAGILAKRFDINEADVADYAAMYYALLNELCPIVGLPYLLLSIERFFAFLWGRNWQDKGDDVPTPLATAQMVAKAVAQKQIELAAISEVRVPDIPTPEVSIAPTPEVLSSPQNVAELTPQEEKPPPRKPGRAPTPKKASRDEYVAGVLAWLKGVTQTPEGERYTPSQLHLVYAKYAEKEGFPVAPPNVFGSIVRNEGKLTTRKTKGQDYFRVAIRGAQLKLVKTDLRTPTPTPSGPTPYPTPTYAVGAPEAVS